MFSSYIHGIRGISEGTYHMVEMREVTVAYYDCFSMVLKFQCCINNSFISI